MPSFFIGQIDFIHRDLIERIFSREYRHSSPLIEECPYLYRDGVLVYRGSNTRSLYPEGIANQLVTMIDTDGNIGVFFDVFTVPRVDMRYKIKRVVLIRHANKGRRPGFSGSRTRSEAHVLIFGEYFIEYFFVVHRGRLREFFLENIGKDLGIPLPSRFFHTLSDKKSKEIHLAGSVLRQLYGGFRDNGVDDGFESREIVFLSE